MWLSHKAVEKMFVDYAGQTVRIVNPRTGEIREAHIFVATLGASSPGQDLRLYVRLSTPG